MNQETKAETLRKLEFYSHVFKFVAVMVILGLAAVNVYLFIKIIPHSETYETALGDFPPPMVLNRVPGYQGPTAKLGEIVVLQQNRCVNRDTTISIQTFWVRQDEATGGVPSLNVIQQTAIRGCSTITLPIAMPERITTGRWHIQGIVRDVPSGDPRYWTSEIFVVVPGT